MIHSNTKKNEEDVFERSYHILGKELYSMYNKSRQFLDNDFIRQINNNPEARRWELLLCGWLQDQKLKLIPFEDPKGGRKGPDFCIDNIDNKIWVEAVSCTAGEDKNKHPPGDITTDHINGEEIITEFGWVDDENIQLRILNALDEKRNKIEKYCEDGVISQNDSVVIALNGSQLKHYSVLNENPSIVRAIFGLGKDYVEVPLRDRTSGNPTGKDEYLLPKIHSQKYIVKKNGAPVEKTAFLANDYNRISAILYSEAPVVCKYLIIHNPKATAPIGDSLVNTSSDDWLWCY